MAKLNEVLIVFMEQDITSDQCNYCGTKPQHIASENLQILIDNKNIPFKDEELPLVIEWAENALPGALLHLSDDSIAVVLRGIEHRIEDKTPPIPAPTFVMSLVYDPADDEDGEDDEDPPAKVPKKGKPKKLSDDPTKHPLCKQHPKLHDRVWMYALGECEVVRINFVAQRCVLEDNMGELHKSIPFEQLRLP